ncbi:GNAT family N-acetyltransferase [Leifsonia sp. AG29]|uniref:GNAT family N-acetyltransferase n=1 Tax=Leifsonia sp. AG29 TaxID=2598860 RepID=UPI00131E05FE|nr:GNAT family N-acetyltransferase [Leifsonia sp. AG29]
MPDLDTAEWPPAPIRTERLLLRASKVSDRAPMIELRSAPEAHEFLGGPHSRAELDRVMPEIPGNRPGFFVIERDDAFAGFVTIEPRDAARPGRIRAGAPVAELAYMLLPSAWGHGYATEACAAVMKWFVSEFPGEPLVVSTQVANAASMRVAVKLGFAEVERHEEWGAEQWFGGWVPAAPR